MNVALIMFKEDGGQRIFELEPGKVIIGRQEDCDLRVPLGEVSRRHAVLIISEKTVTLRDMGSANGTYVNNQRISEQELTPGDHVVVGPVVFTIQINGEPADVRPVHTRLESKSAMGKGGATVTAKGEKPAEEEDFILGDDDPISELEALAASDETAELDLSASDLDIKHDD